LPEEIPAGGFVASEDFLETNSVQCRTRVCIVHDFEGDPRLTTEACNPTNPARPMECDTPGLMQHSPETVEEKIHCSCRCEAAAGSSTPTCRCPGGFECVPVLNAGGTGIAGSYCVRDNAP
jgi:hypothetical protein